jgi:hypothetical protein
MRLRLALATLATLSIGFADTLTLRSGKTIQGSYLGGNARQVRMAVGDRVETFDVTEVSTLQFEAGHTTTQPQAAPAASAQPAPRAAAPAASETADQRRILRPEPSAVPSAQTTVADASELPAGSTITIRMIDDVDSQVNSVGQTFRASIDEPVVVGGRTVIPRGADVVTKLVEMKDPSKLTGGGQLTLDLASITVNGKLVEIDTQGLTTTGESRKGETGKVIGGTAALGAIIGAIAGGGRGAAIGAVSGAGAGTAIQVLTQGPRVRVPSETRLTFTLQQPVRL